MSTIWEEILFSLQNLDELKTIFFPNLFSFLLISFSISFSIFIPGFLVLKMWKKKTNKKIKFHLNLIILIGISIRWIYSILLLSFNCVSIYSSILYYIVSITCLINYIQKNYSFSKFFKNVIKPWFIKIKAFYSGSISNKISTFIVIYYIAYVVLMGLFLRGPPGDDPVSHILFIKFITNQQAFLPEWEQVASNFLISKQITYPLVVHIFSSFDYILVSLLFNANFFINQQIRVLMLILFISLVSFAKNIDNNQNILYYIVSLVLLQNEHIFLIKWGGFAFIFGLIFGLSYIALDLNFKSQDINGLTKKNLFFRYSLQFLFLAFMFLVHPVVMGILLLYHFSNFIFGLLFEKKKISKVLTHSNGNFFDNFVIIGFFLMQLFYSLIKVFFMSSLHVFASRSSLFAYIFTADAVMPWNYFRLGQTGIITGTLIQTNSNFLNSTQILLTVFNLVTIFAFIYILIGFLQIFKKQKKKKKIPDNSKNLKLRLVVWTSSSSLILFLFNFPYLVHIPHIKFLFAFFLFRIHRSYSILIQLAYPLMSSAFLLNVIPKIKKKLKKRVTEENKRISYSKIWFITKITSLIVLIFIGSTYFTITMIRSTIYYDYESKVSYDYIINNFDSESSLIMNDKYGNWLPVVSDFKVTYSFSTGTSDMIFSRTKTSLILYELYRGNYTYAVPKLYYSGITHIFFRWGSYNSSIEKFEKLKMDSLGEIIFRFENTFIFQLEYKANYPFFIIDDL